MTLRRMCYHINHKRKEKTHSDPIDATEVFSNNFVCTKTLLSDKYWIIQGIFSLPTGAFSRERPFLATINYFSLALLSVEVCKKKKVLTKIEKSILF